MAGVVMASYEDPLSDEFILEINRKATTWEVLICFFNNKNLLLSIDATLTAFDKMHIY